MQLSEKLSAPYNIEHVADMLDRRLSDAVDTFQQNVDEFVSAVRRHQRHKSFRHRLFPLTTNFTDFLLCSQLYLFLVSSFFLFNCFFGTVAYSKKGKVLLGPELIPVYRQSARR